MSKSKVNIKIMTLDSLSGGLLSQKNPYQTKPGMDKKTIRRVDLVECVLNVLGCILYSVLGIVKSVLNFVCCFVGIDLDVLG